MPPSKRRLVWWGVEVFTRVDFVVGLQQTTYKNKAHSISVCCHVVFVVQINLFVSVTASE